MSKFLLSLFLSLGLMSGANATSLVQSQCDMLGALTGEMTAREIKGEAYEKYLPELFPRFDKFPEDLQALILTIPRVIKKDRKVYPDTASNPQAHEQAMVEFCYSSGGQVEVMQRGLDEFIAR